MRVIAGTFRSRPLEAPRGTATRPTSDRLRETLFNVLSPRIAGARFADLYAGSGAVGIEAISRGAEHVWFAESSPSATTAIRGNLAKLKVGGGYSIEDRSVAHLLRALIKAQRMLDIVFLDPPYEAAEEYSGTLILLAREHLAILAPGAIVVVEHQKKAPLAERYGALECTRVLKQGDVALSFYAVAKNSDAGS
jgi:16S rRNA (guanine(966)-N(2))-methyltransferase RsmD